MRQVTLIGLMLIAAFPLQAALSFDASLVVPLDELTNYYPNKKCHLEWEDNEFDFDPLRIDFNRTKEKDFISEEEKGCINNIKNILREKKIEGIVFGKGGFDSKVLIGNHVFSTGDELGFVENQEQWTPINSERSVILSEVTKEKATFLISGKKGKSNNSLAGENKNKFEILWEDFFKFR